MPDNIAPDFTPLPADATPAQILTAAADQMQARGKCDFTFSDDDGRVCALGALRLVTCGDPKAFPSTRPEWMAYSAARRRLILHLNVDNGSIAVSAWSDSHTQDEVVAAMRAAAALAHETAS